jgi:hypothetical protein
MEVFLSLHHTEACCVVLASSLSGITMTLRKGVLCAFSFLALSRRFVYPCDSSYI